MQCATEVANRGLPQRPPLREAMPQMAWQVAVRKFTTINRNKYKEDVLANRSPSSKGYVGNKYYSLNEDFYMNIISFPRSYL